MYGILTDIYHHLPNKHQPNVGKHTNHTSILYDLKPTESRWFVGFHLAVLNVTVHIIFGRSLGENTESDIKRYPVQEGARDPSYKVVK